MYTLKMDINFIIIISYIAKMTLLSLAVSIPLTNVTKVSSRAMERFKCIA